MTKLCRGNQFPTLLTMVYIYSSITARWNHCDISCYESTLYVPMSAGRGRGNLTPKQNICQCVHSINLHKMCLILHCWHQFHQHWITWPRLFSQVELLWNSRLLFFPSFQCNPVKSSLILFDCLFRILSAITQSSNTWLVGISRDDFPRSNPWIPKLMSNNSTSWLGVPDI